MKHTIWFVLSATLSAAALVLPACSDPEPDREMSRPEDYGFQQTPHEAMVGQGQKAYERYCIGCHGVGGDGNGEAARFLHPRPRNFQLGNFKFSSTRSGKLPTDDDLRRSIRNGLKGSAMPEWTFLPNRTVDALIAYIKTLSPKWTERQPAAPIPLVDDPYRSTEDKSEAISRGEAVYHGYATCWTCHPSYVPAEKINEHLATFGSKPRSGFRENVHRAEGKPNTEGEMLYPPDFHRDFVKGGMQVDDLYRSIAAGITGTAMPTWVDSMHYMEGEKVVVQQADLWAMAYYVQSLIVERPQKLVQGRFELRPRALKIYPAGVIPPPVVVEPAASTEGDGVFEE